MKKQHLKLNEQQHADLQDLVAKGSLPARVFKRATALLELDQGKSLQAVAQTLNANYNTVAAFAPLRSWCCKRQVKIPFVHTTNTKCLVKA